MARRKRFDGDEPIDRLSARIDQARAAVLALRQTFGDGVDDESSLPPRTMYEALWGVSDQLRDAQAAFIAMCRERSAERHRNPPPKRELSRAERLGLTVITSSPTAPDDVDER